MRIAEIAPPWVKVPPDGYGGIEWVVSLLADGLVDRGHEVTLYASGDSTTKARLRSPLDSPAGFGGGAWYRMVNTLAAHSVPAFLEADRYDIIHDHSGAFAACLGALSDTPMLHTLHGPFNPGARRLFRTVADRIYFNSISDSQRSGCPELNYAGTIHNAVRVADYPFRAQKEDYALFLGRFNADKGVHNAIHIARRAGVPLRMAGKVDPGPDTEYFEKEVMPHLDGKSVIFEGEVGGRQKNALLAGARFLLFPIQWQEPFGLVMAEALACGTPVLATAMGAAPEIVEDGEVGVVVDAGNWGGMVAAIRDGRLDAIDPRRCREHVSERFGVVAMLDGYEAAFEKILLDNTPGRDRARDGARSGAGGRTGGPAGDLERDRAGPRGSASRTPVHDLRGGRRSS